MMKQIIGFLSLLLASLLTFPQSDSTQSVGKVISGQVVIQKKKEVSLPTANKIYLPAGVPGKVSSPIPIILRSSENEVGVQMRLTAAEPAIPKRIWASNNENFIKAGFGNYRSPVFHLGYFQDVSGWSLGSKAYFESFNGGPIGGDNSRSSEVFLNINGAKKISNWIFLPTISAQRLGYRFYGNSLRENGQVPSDSEKGSAAFFSLGSRMQRDNGGWKYGFTPGFFLNRSSGEAPGLLNQDVGAQLVANAEFLLKKEQRGGVDMRLFASQYKGAISYGRSLVTFNPWFEIKESIFQARLGIAVASSAVDKHSVTRVYPDIRASYRLSDQWLLKAAITGGQQMIGLDSLLQENQFLNDSTILGVLEDRVAISGGFIGTLADGLQLDAMLTYRNTNGLPFFVSGGVDSTRFNVSYDGGSVGVFSLKSSLRYEPGPFTRIGVTAEFLGYALDTFEKPWHQPTWIFKPFFTHSVVRKLTISIAGTIMGGIVAPDDSFNQVKLPAFADMSVGANYLFNDQLSAFVEINNLLGSEYERFLGFPARGITFKIGGQYRF